MKAWQKANPEKYRKRLQAWRATNPDKVRSYSTNRRARRKAEDPEAVRYGNRARLLKPYGLTPESWDALFVAQDRRCAICRSSNTPDGRWHTDHDDAIGKRAVRGILCVRCNIGVGQFEDDAERLRAAARYLDRYKESRS